MDRGAWWAAVHGVVKSQTWLSNFTFTFHFHALEKEMASHSSVLAWRIPGTGEPGGLLSMVSHRVGLDWSDLVTAAAAESDCFPFATLVFDFNFFLSYSLVLKNTIVFLTYLLLLFYFTPKGSVLYVLISWICYWILRRRAMKLTKKALEEF